MICYTRTDNYYMECNTAVRMSEPVPSHNKDESRKHHGE